MPAPTPRATDHSAFLHTLEAYIETLKAENETLKRRLVAAEAHAAQETARAEEAIAKFAALTERLDALALARSRPWWRRLVAG
jgi:hypothetical protein